VTAGDVAAMLQGLFARPGGAPSVAGVPVDSVQRYSDGVDEYVLVDFEDGSTFRVLVERPANTSDPAQAPTCVCGVRLRLANAPYGYVRACDCDEDEAVLS
jgi:hypothetical protein